MERRKLQTNINAFLTSSGDLAIEAEATVLAKSNALRKAAKHKELVKYDKDIGKKSNETKNIEGVA